ncbi:TetR/AcrR family transcriptional regulator [Nocardia callitridis]|uniref:TetR/AcrR family transcriptional regulator n=1 Tax=Nocardia callitridis TaxID=648753 RepID=A0ABP9KEY6_9NOCA
MSQPRGPYAKTAGRRQQILDIAMEVFGRQGFRGGSLREIAERAGLTQAGVLHHFGSKEQLLIAVLRRRDEDRAALDTGEASTHTDRLRAQVSVSAGDRGLTQLFTTLAAEATDPDHPAHQYFADRYRHARIFIAERIESARAAGELTSDIDTEALAHLLIAVMDGLQTQWLLDPDLDMVATFDALLKLLSPPDGRDTD